MTRISKRVKRSNKSRSYKLRGGTGRFSIANPGDYVTTEDLETALAQAQAKASLSSAAAAEPPSSRPPSRPPPPPPPPPPKSLRAAEAEAAAAAEAEEPPPRPAASLKHASLYSALLSASAELLSKINLFENESKYNSALQIYKNIYELLMVYISKGIKLMLFDFDNTVSKKHIYNLLTKENIDLNKILAEINDEHTPKNFVNLGTYFPKIYESFHYKDEFIRKDLIFHAGIDGLSDEAKSESFFKVFCIIAKQLGLQIGIVSRGSCDVIQKVLDTVFTNPDVRMVCIPDFRIEGGNILKSGIHTIPNNKCPGSVGLAAGAEHFKNIAIMQQINMIGGILPENVIMFDDDNRNLKAIKANENLKAMYTYHLNEEDIKRGIDFKTLRAAIITL
jgi:hypothetical protein